MQHIHFQQRDRSSRISVAVVIIYRQNENRITIMTTTEEKIIVNIIVVLPRVEFYQAMSNYKFNIFKGAAAK